MAGLNDGTWQFHHTPQVNMSIPGVVNNTVSPYETPSYQTFGTTDTSSDLSWGDRIGNWFGNLFSSPSSTYDSWGDYLSSLNMTQDQFNILNPNLQSQYINLFNNQRALSAMDKYAGFGPNLATAKLGFDILGGIGSWVQGNKNLKFAKDQFNWQKDQIEQQNALAWDAYLNKKNRMGAASAAFEGRTITPETKQDVLNNNR